MPETDLLNLLEIMSETALDSSPAKCCLRIAEIMALEVKAKCSLLLFCTPLSCATHQSLEYEVFFFPSDISALSDMHATISLQSSPILTALSQEVESVHSVDNDSALKNLISSCLGSNWPPDSMLHGYAVKLSDLPVAMMLLPEQGGSTYRSVTWKSLSQILILLAQRTNILYAEKDRLYGALSEIATQLQRAFKGERPEQADVLQRVLECSSKLLNAKKCALFLVDSSEKRLVLERAAGDVDFEKVRDISTYPLENYDPAQKGTGVTPWVLHRRKPFSAHSFSELKERSEGHWKGNWDRFMYGGQEQAREQFQCVYMYPLTAGDRAIGVLTHENRTNGKLYFDPVEERLIDIIGALVTNLVISQRLERVKYDKALPSISAALVAHFGKDDFYDQLLKETQTILNAQICSLFLLQGGDTLSLKAIAGVSDEIKKRLRDFSYGNYHTAMGVTPWILRHNQPFNARSFPDLIVRSEHIHVGQWDDIIYNGKPEDKFKSLYAIPLRVGPDLIGVLKVENKTVPPFYFTESDERMCDLIGLLVAIGANYENAQIFGAMMKAADIGFLASGIAHEFYNNLQNMLALLSGMERVHTEEEQRNNIVLFQREINRAVKTIDNFRIFRDRVETVEGFDLDKLVRDLMALSEKRRQDHAIEIFYNNRDVRQVKMNASQVQSIIVNLLRNAIDSVETKSDNKRIDIDVRRKEQNEIEIVVTDSGTGIRKEDQKNLFLPFFTTKGPESMGVGLFWVHRIITRMGGKIQVEPRNKYGGATFIVTLPDQQ
jgi:signal transduction histidine kinase